jgi:CubicO group peptidase (beta-lactamase class C family)
VANGGVTGVALDNVSIFRGEQMMNSRGQIPDWITYPGEQWKTISVSEAGFNSEKFDSVIESTSAKGATFAGEIHNDNEWGAVLTRGGYLVHAWGDPTYRFQTASVGKAFTRAVIGLAVKEGLISPDDLVSKTWTGEGQLSHPHKLLDQGHHKTLTWRHLIGPRDAGYHSGGFSVTNGFFWRQGSYAQGIQIPEWSAFTGDPFCDNYSHAPPGTVECYSSGGIWRLSQALTVLWDQDIKEVLDDRLFSKIGIQARNWDWIAGRTIFENKTFYPSMPGYGDFVDPPYECNGHKVRGGGGWAIMNALDLARFGLLVATGGVWNGEQLIDSEWLRSHGGGNGSFVYASPETCISIAVVTTKGLPPLDSFNELVDGPVCQ